jgi:DNA repair exonuclease SbcCD nuclease subunit
MRVLLLSDHHSFNWRLYSTTTSSGISSRLQDGLDVLNQIAMIAKKEQVDLVLFGGDLFHVRGTIQIQTWNLVFDAITKLRLAAQQVGLLVGNHDQTARSGDVHSVYSLGMVATVMDKPQWYTFAVDATKIGGKPCALHVLAVPYTKDHSAIVQSIESLSASPPASLEATALLGHFGVSGAKVGGNFVLVDKDVPQLSELHAGDIDQVFLGHYHEPQQLGYNVRYLGATHHHNWGDVGSERGCWLWDTAENQPYSEPKLIPLKYPQFKILDAGSKITQEQVKGNFIKIRCPATPNAADMDGYLRLGATLGARSVEFTWAETVSGTTSQVAFSPGMDLEAMVDSYVDEVERDVQLDDELLVEMGKELLRASL